MCDINQKMLDVGKERAKKSGYRDEGERQAEDVAFVWGCFYSISFCQLTVLSCDSSGIHRILCLLAKR